jgi:hypothetical protein
MAPPGSDTAVALSPEQKQVFDGLGSRMWVVSQLLFVLAVLRLAGGALALWHRDLAGGLLSVVEGLAAGFLGMVLLTGAGDARFVAQTQGYEKAHILNTVASLKVFYTAQVAVGALVAVVLMIRFFLLVFATS